jgi:hypothetical protein
MNRRVPRALPVRTSGVGVDLATVQACTLVTGAEPPWCWSWMTPKPPSEWRLNPHPHWTSNRRFVEEVWHES